MEADLEKEALEEVVYKLLYKYHLTIATAESCTGGLLAGRLINVPGISSNFKEGYITYANESKEKLVGVSHDTLEHYGAVSEETAAEMAQGCAKSAGTDIGIGVTGIAGPDGGTEEKPVGLVYIGCCYRGKTRVRKFLFSGNRREVREASVESALAFLQEIISDEVME